MNRYAPPSVIVGPNGTRLRKDDLPEAGDEARADDPVDGEWKLWNDEITAARAAEERWRKEALGAEHEYFGDRDEPMIGSGSKRERGKVHAIHANIETLKPSVYSSTPEPIIRRRFRDGRGDKPLDAVVAEVAQRLAIALIDLHDFDAAMEGARDDWLIAGRGGARVFYRAEIEDAPVLDPATGAPLMGEDGAPLLQPEKRSETVRVRHWPWRRALMSPAECWEEVRWVAYETWLTRREIERHPSLGEEAAQRVSYDKPGLSKGGQPIVGRKRDTGDDDATGAAPESSHDVAQVWEIWDKTERRVIWWSDSCADGLLGFEDDPLELMDFFDGPPPLLASCVSGSMQPRPDIAFYIEHAREIDVASEKLSKLLDIISLSGVYAGEYKDAMKRLLSGKNAMVAMPDWMMFAEKGGLSKLIEWLPIDNLVKAAQALALMRDQSKMLMYEVTGISDIVRGQGDPEETATAQQIKGSYAGLRLNVKQQKFARFALQAIRIMIEIACEHFDTETIAALTDMDMPMTEAEREMIAQQAAMLEQAAQVQAQMQQAMQAKDAAAADQAFMALMQMGVDPRQPVPPPPDVPETSWEAVRRVLSDDLLRSYSIQIETDGTILTDEADDREARVEFLTVMPQIAQQIVALAPAMGGDFKVVKELLLFAIRGFRKARTLETLIASLPDEMDPNSGQEDAAITVAKIRAETDKVVAEMRAKTDVTRAQIAAKADIAEQQLENEGDREARAADAQERERDRRQSDRHKGADFKARAAEMGAQT